MKNLNFSGPFRLIICLKLKQVKQTAGQFVAMGYRKASFVAKTACFSIVEYVGQFSCVLDISDK